MDSSAGQRLPPVMPPSQGGFNHFHHHHHHNSVPHHHHHHHFHVSPNCPIHNHMLHLQNHSPSCPIFASSYYPPQSQNPETLASVPYSINNPLDLQVFETQQNISDGSLAMPDEHTVELEEVGEQLGEEDEDLVFVLTDEWREFFAKSEAKRRLAKKQAKKRGKNRIEQ